MMEVVYKTEDSDIANVFIGDLGGGRLVEFVESVQPPLTFEKKWVLIVSTMLGCPVGCRMCDAGRFYGGKLSADEIFSQIEYLVSLKFPGQTISTEKFKIQFSRMGDPALNDSVLVVLRSFNRRFHSPGFMPGISTVAPAGRDRFFDDLMIIKNELYGSGNFQLQFSVHTTSVEERDKLIPVKKWSLEKMSRYGEQFCERGDKKVTLNFVFSGDLEIDTGMIRDKFDPAKFLIKITPVNPTVSAVRNGIRNGYSETSEELAGIAEAFRAGGFNVILSRGEIEENRIGSNCGQYIGAYLKSGESAIPGGGAYTYALRDLK